MSILTKTLRRFLIRAVRLMAAGGFLGVGCALLYVLVRHHAHDPSIFYRDSAVLVTWGSWLASSCAAILIYFFGMGAFLVPVILGYAGLLVGGWRELSGEQARVLSFIVLLVSVSFWYALGAGVWWHGMSIFGGLLGAGLRTLVSAIDPLVVRGCLLGVMAISVTFITRLAFVSPLLWVFRAIVVFMRKYRIVQRMGSLVGVSAQKIGVSVCALGRACVRVFKNPAFASHEDVRDEFMDESIDSIVRDVFWAQCKKTSGVVTRGVVTRGVVTFVYPFTHSIQFYSEVKSLRANGGKNSNALFFAHPVCSKQHGEPSRGGNGKEYSSNKGQREQRGVGVFGDRERSSVDVSEGKNPFALSDCESSNNRIERVNGPAKYQLPPKDLLSEDRAREASLTGDQQHAAQQQAVQQKVARVLEEKLSHFGINGHITAIKSGPVVTCLEYAPTIDTKISKILALENDLALALQALSLRIVAPIPGTSVVGFEVARTDRQIVSFAHLVRAFEPSTDFELPLLLGCDVVGQPVIADLTRFPHLLMAGATGSGKSVALHTIILSLLLYKKPEELQLILIDPKRLELNSYAGIAHLAAPIIHEANQAIQALEWVLDTMQKRYELMAAAGVRTIAQYRNQGREPVPTIVVVIDELADLMMVAGNRLELLIARIAQMARAAGIHLVVATQRPSVDVVTGLIKINFVSRIALRVTSAFDSRVILDEDGAQRLIGAGDMLLRDAQGRLKRVHGAYCTTQDSARVVAHIRAQAQNISQSHFPLFTPREFDPSVSGSDEPLYQEVLKFLNEIDEVSISLVQRRFKIGFNRSARIIDLLETEGRVVRVDGGKTRRVVRSQ